MTAVVTDLPAPEGRLGTAAVVGSFLSLLAISLPNAYGAAVPSVSAATGVPAATAGQLTAVHGVGAFVGLMLFVVVGRRVTTRRVARVGLSALLLGALGIAANPATARADADTGAFVLLAVAVAVVGVAFGVVLVTTNTLLTNRGTGAGLLNSANGMFGLGAVLLPLLVGLADLRTAALVTAGIAALTLPALRATPDLSDDLRASAAATASVRSSGAGTGDHRDALAGLARRAWRGNGSRPWVWVFGVGIGVEISTAAWAATHLVSVGVDEQRAATAVAGFFASFTLARFVVGAVGDRWSRRGVVVGCNLLAAGAVLASTVVPAPSLAWVVVGLGVGPVFGTTLSWLHEATADPDGARRMTVGGAVGGVVAPALVGVLVGALGAGVIPWSIATLAIVTATLAARLPATDEQRTAPAGAAASDRD